ncbi:hypothetical protein B0H14DRAFT_3033320 [Mycena olivaceomarginata]|nr:hypothetical protein B0H14DRAFT_3033320 [Mycena olivaceomarginata]
MDGVEPIHLNPMFDIGAIPADIILEIFSIVHVSARDSHWWKDCASFASTCHYIRACCLPALFRRTRLKIWPGVEAELSKNDPGDMVLGCFKHFSLILCEASYEHRKSIQAATLEGLLSLISRMQSLESIELRNTSTVPFTAIARALSALPLLRRWGPGNRRVFDHPSETEVSIVSAGLYRVLQRSLVGLETLDVPIWCFPLQQLIGTLWTNVRILCLRGYLPKEVDHRPASDIPLIPFVVRTDPTSLVGGPQYLGVESVGVIFPPQLRHLSLIDVEATDPILYHLPPSLDSLSIIDTRSRKYWEGYEKPKYDPNHDSNYKTWLNQDELTSVVARNPSSFSGLTYFRISISTGRPTDGPNVKYWTRRSTFSLLQYRDIPLDLVRLLVAACPRLERLDLHLQRDRFPDWEGIPAYPRGDTEQMQKKAQKRWFDLLDGWLTSLSQRLPALHRGAFGFGHTRKYERWQSFILRAPGGKSLKDSTPSGFTPWHIRELTDYDKDEDNDGSKDVYFNRAPEVNPLLRRFADEWYPGVTRRPRHGVLP